MSLATDAIEYSCKNKIDAIEYSYRNKFEK